MGLITIPNTFTSGTTILSAEVNSNFSTIYNSHNGNISDANISGSAAIADTKLAAISTGGKVNFTALTVSSQTQGDVMYFNGTNWVRLAAGSDKTIFQSQGSSANPQWIAPATAAEVLTGTDDEKPVTASTVIGHQGVIKGWADYDGSAVTTDLTGVNDSFNVASITDVDAGNHVVAWDVDFGSDNYAVAGGGKADGVGIPVVLGLDADGDQVAATCDIATVRPDTGADIDADPGWFMAIGDR